MKGLFLIVVAVSLLALVRSQEAEDQRERFVALYRTATTYTVSTSTVSAYYTCASTSSTVACSGRRRRRRKVDGMNLPTAEDTVQSEQLRGSMEEVPVAPAAAAEGKLGFTVWTTSTSTLIMTTTSLNSATTVSLVYLCTAPSGVSTVGACG